MATKVGASRNDEAYIRAWHGMTMETKNDAVISVVSAADQKPSWMVAFGG